ncbi:MULTISPECIES: GerW family sporulation protein [unclassified Virgibacillus]|uniref:GerW family sporulation protein n=1 Tax=unclassified Virgibacillus TaxID=2620237 RepID=UPI0024DE5120|nr:GerW family sporulation protein [Virgibacillus sp. LDC-1]
MEEHPIQGLMTTAMENLKDMVEVNTIIGDPVESPDGSMIIPVSKLGFGFAAGGSEFNNKFDSSNGEAILPFGGGSGGGVSISPVAFLIVNEKGVKMVHLNENVHIYEKMIDFAPKAAEKIQQMMKDSNKKNQSKELRNDKSKKKQKDDEEAKAEPDDDSDFII